MTPLVAAPEDVSRGAAAGGETVAVCERAAGVETIAVAEATAGAETAAGAERAAATGLPALLFVPSLSTTQLETPSRRCIRVVA